MIYPQTAELPPVPAAVQPPASAVEGDAGTAVVPQRQVDHLHQVFVTKNAVLCSEVKKNFQVLVLNGTSARTCAGNL